eukprot:SAG31_NODE_427_length_15813_cov_13.679649_18_plen_88_part_00
MLAWHHLGCWTNDSSSSAARRRCWRRHYFILYFVLYFAANAKHYVNNNQETNRNTVLEIVDERTRFEMYYPPFEGSANAGVGSVMCR